jgi:hypothetical protein
MKMDDGASAGRSKEVTESRARAISAAIDDTAKAYALGSTVARAHILSDFVRESAARLAETLAERPHLFAEDAGWALGAARRAQADLAEALCAFDTLLGPHADEQAPSWETAEVDEVKERQDAIELDREFLEILGLASYATRYVGADDNYRAHLLKEAVGGIVREYAGVHFNAAAWEKVRSGMAAKINRAPLPKHMSAAPVDFDDGYDSDGYD